MVDEDVWEDTMEDEGAEGHEDEEGEESPKEVEYGPGYTEYTE